MPSYQSGKYDRCKDRSHGHDWFITDVQRRSSFGLPVWHMCANCGTIRKRILDMRGNIAAQYYKHPADYKYHYSAGQLRLNEVSAYRRQQRMMKQENINS